MMNKTGVSTVQKWGNSLAVRIPIDIARSAAFELGTPVEVTLEKTGISFKSIGKPKLTLSERLKKFNPKKHGKEIMVSIPVGLEKF